MNIPFLDLQAQYKTIKSEIDGAIKRVIDRQFFILGEELEAFEREFADYLGSKYVVGIASGTDGLILSLWALGVKKGDEVITPANSFIATTLAITQMGATPVLVDVDPLTYQIDVKEVEKKITNRTKVILPVHLYGAPCDMTALIKVAKKYKVYVVEDACQAHGATFENKKVGTFGELGVFSFYPGKNLGAYGDGGAICTNSTELFEKLKKLRNYGQSKKYYHDEFGLNSRLDELQAAVLRVKLKHLDEWNKKRNILAVKYNQQIKKYKTQMIYGKSSSCYHLFTIEAEKRDELMVSLKGNGINTQIHYPVPIHLQECYLNLGYKEGDFPIVEGISKKIVSLPLYPELSFKDQLYITSALNSLA